MPAPSLPLLSASSANALLSDLRPTTLAPQALEYINLLLDELLVAIVTSSESINYCDFRTRGVPAALSESESSARGTHPAALGALGRAAVGEAEVEIRSWYAAHPTAQKDVSGFPPDGKGRGLVASREEERAPFPVQAAVELMLVKVASFSSFAEALDPIPTATTEAATSSWTSAGGDGSEETVAPAGLWLTAVLEHICGHILSKLSQVVARDSSVVTANVQDLYTALCEDDAVYGFFKRMDAREQIENHARAATRTKRGGPRSGSSMGVTRSSPHDSPYGSHSSLPSSVEPNTNLHPRVPSAHSTTATRPVSEQFYKSVINAAKSVPTGGHHKRASSILSARQPSEDDSISKQPPVAENAAEEDFDAILRSGETMRMSLTPSRFSTFESSPNTSPQRKDSGRASDHLSPTLPSSSETSLLSMSTQASTTDSRVNGYRAAAGRSWSSQQTKLMPRGPTIEEKDEDDPNPRGQSVIELLRSEPRHGSPLQPHERTVPAVILGSPVPPEPEVPEWEAGSPTLVSEPIPMHRTSRSASEGGILETEVNPDTYRQPRHMSERLEARRETRDLVNFLQTTAPPSASVAPDFPRPVSPPQQRGALPRFKNILHRMSSTTKRQTYKEAKEEDNSFKAWAERTLLPSPSIQTLRSQGDAQSHNSAEAPPTHSREPSAGLRSQKSQSSVGSASTLHGHSSLPSQTRGQDPQSSTAPVTTREVLRRASIVRKWAAGVTHGEQKTSLTRRKSTPLSVSSPLAEDSEGVEDESGDQRGGTGSETGSLNSRPGLGLGLGITALSTLAAGDAAMGDGEKYDSDNDDNNNGTPEAALATLTAGSRSSPALSRPTTMFRAGSPQHADAPSLTAVEATPAMTDSPRSTGAQLQHERVAELREAEDAVPSAGANGTPGTPVAPSRSASTRSLGSRHSASPVLERRSLPPRSPASMSTRALPGSSSPQPSSKAGSYVGLSKSGASVSDSPKASIRSLPTGSSAGASASVNANATSTARVAAAPSVGTSARSSPASTAAPLPHDGCVALADLTPLRHLLDHATTARECQLLLDAILSQLGVPRAGEGSDRVAAWLLGGSPMATNRNWADKVTRKAPPPPSAGSAARSVSLSASSSSMRSPKSRRKKLGPDATMKSLPALPGDTDRGEVWDITSEPDVSANGNGNGHAREERKDKAGAAGDVAVEKPKVEKAEEEAAEDEVTADVLLGEMAVDDKEIDAAAVEAGKAAVAGVDTRVLMTA